MTFGEEIVSRLMQLERDVRDLKTFELNHVSKFKIDNNLDVIGNLNVSGTAQFVGDLYTEPWTEYSGSTVTGWSSFTAKQVYYKKIGKLVFCAFNLNGTSNTGTSSFTLPNTSTNNPAAWQAVHSGSDNGGAYAFGRAGIAANSNTVALYKDAGSTAWTASGAKHIRGLIWYESG